MKNRGSKRGQKRGKKHRAIGDPYGPMHGNKRNPRWSQLPNPPTSFGREARRARDFVRRFGHGWMW